jgi:glutathione synthase/RimK-type ligase-like ATP-grasp enzyme
LEKLNVRPAAPVVLVVCGPGDEHALAVALHLAELGVRAVPADLARLPQHRFEAALGAGRPGRFLVGTAEGPIDPATCVAVWWRRPRPVDPAGPGDGERRLSNGEWTHAIGGLSRAAGGYWVNDPHAEEAARKKLVQLEAAHHAGLTVPRTLVTNDVAAARAFVRSCRRGAVVKSLSSLLEGGHTRRLSADDPRLAERLRVGPAILQERVDGLDLRVAAVGGKLFAMSLDARAGGDPDDVRVDWDRVRTTARPVRLPAPVARALRALQRRLGLTFGAIDLRLRKNGEHVFLEVNPGGQWLHQEAATGQPIAVALARLLAAGAPGAARPRAPRLTRAGPSAASASRARSR